MRQQPIADSKTLQCVEYIDMKGLWRLLNTNDIDKTNLLTILGKIDRIVDGKGVVFHDWERSSNSPSFGRYYASGSLISQSKLCRSYLAPDYVELDLVASNPALLWNVMASNGIHMHCLERYLRERDDIHEMLYRLVPDELWNMVTKDGDLYTPKLFINSVMMGSMEIWRNLRIYLIEGNADSDYIRNLVREFGDALDYIYDNYLNYPVNEDAHSAKASRLSSVLMTLESIIIKGLIEELHNYQIIGTNNDYYECGYGYDGIMIRTTEPHRAARILNNRIQQMQLVYCRIKMKTIDRPEMSHVVSLWDRVVRVPDLNRFHYSQKLLIRYPTGAGKTYQSINYALQHYQRILVIVHRQQLAHNIKKNYPRFGSYLKTPESPASFNDDLQIICLNSLHRLPQPAKYQCIIADEICSLFSQFVEMKMPTLSKEMFKAFLTAPQVKFIGMDALLADDDIEFIKTIVEDVEVITPNCLQTPKKKCTVYPDVGLLKQDIVENVRNGKRVCIAYSCAITRMKGFLDTLNVEYIDINRFTKAEHEIEDFRNIQVVAFSPTMDAGVDVSFYDEVTGERLQYFDIVYGIFDKNNTRPKQAVQMLGRVRDCSEYKAAFCGGYRNEIHETRESFNQFLRQRSNVIEQFGLDVFVTNEFRVEFVDNFSYKVTWNMIKNERKRTKSNYMRYFQYNLMLNSWTIDIFKPDDYNHELATQIEESEKKAIIEECRQVALAPVMSDDEAQSQYGEDLTQQQHRQLLAYRVTKAFGLDCSRELIPEALQNPGNIESLRARLQYFDYLQQKQFDELFPYDETGKIVKFERLKHYRQHALLYYRTKALVKMCSNVEDFTFDYTLYKETSKEIVAKLHILLINIGFTELDKVLPTPPRENNITKTICGKLNLKDYLEEKCALHVKQVGDGYRLCSYICSDDYDEEKAFFIENCPFIYAEKRPEQCPSCFKSVMKLSRHVCRSPGEGYRFVQVGNKRARECIYCEVVIESNFKRHRDRCQ